MQFKINLLAGAKIPEKEAVTAGGKHVTVIGGGGSGAGCGADRGLCKTGSLAAASAIIFARCCRPALLL